MKKKYKFLIYAIVLIIIKQVLINKLPIYAIGGSSCDDLLMVNLETTLLRMDWLGTFNSLTLVKGMFFPLFLAINTFIGISYINSVTLFYSVACLIFIYAIKDLFKKKYPLYIIFTILLFNPIMYSLEVVQRVYRNSLTPGQVLLILASIFAIFINRKKEKKSLWLWSILGGVSLATFWNTREDAIWILPFVIVFTLIMLIEHFVINKKAFDVKKLIIFVLPIFFLIISNLGISTINYIKYDTFTRVDESNTAFSNAIAAIYSVPPKEDIPYVSVTREKLERLYEVSPSLKAISNEIDVKIKDIDQYGRNPKDNEIEDGWFWWVLRFAAEDKGYYDNAKKANEFFNNVTDEITSAQDKGLLEKQKTMPSALMSPWRKGYTKELINTMFKIFKFTNSYEEVEAYAIESTGTPTAIKLFEIATNDKAIFPNTASNINGYYYAKKDYQISTINIDDGSILETINCEANVPCSISFNLQALENTNNIALQVIDVTGKEIEVLKLSDDLTSDSNDFRKYQFNEYANQNATYYQTKVLNVYVSRLNMISKIYKVTGIICSLLGLISYLVISFIALFKNHKLMDKWLIITSIIASYLVLCLGVSYNEISSCPSISTLYLCGTYPLIISFWTMSITTLINYLKHKE